MTSTLPKWSISHHTCRGAHTQLHHDIIAPLVQMPGFTWLLTIV